MYNSHTAFQNGKRIAIPVFHAFATPIQALFLRIFKAMPELYFNNRRYADLPLHYGRVPPWLANRMSLLGGAIVEAIVMEYGKPAVLSRLSDPFWFQSLGCVMGMDWHSSGITTSVMGALKRSVNPRFKELGIYIAGGKGKHSRQTPAELVALGNRTGLNANELVRSSKLTAKVDNNLVQDGFQVYLHTFVVSDSGEWVVVQQGMNTESGMARRYHWHSEQVRSFIENPHTSIYGQNQGVILNLTDLQAGPAKNGIMDLVKEDPGYVLPEIQRIILPLHHEVQAKDVNMKRLGSVLMLAHERSLADFEELVLLEGVGPRTIQSLALVSEIIHGAPSRFTDPARFSFAHGGKDGHPFPVPLNTYDETIAVLKTGIAKAKLGNADKTEALKNLSYIAQLHEQCFEPHPDAFEKALAKEKRDAHKYGGRTVSGKAKPPKDDGQLKLF